MDPPVVRKPRARPPPPARKQSLPALASALDEAEDTFDEELGGGSASAAASPSYHGDSAESTPVRRARSDQALSSADHHHQQQRSPSHLHGAHVLPTLPATGVPQLRARPSPNSLPREAISEHPQPGDSQQDEQAGERETCAGR